MLLLTIGRAPFLVFLVGCQLVAGEYTLIDAVGDASTAFPDGSAGNDGCGASGDDGGVCVQIDADTALPAHGGIACPSGGGTCYPQSETTFTPQWIPPVSQSHVCSCAQISAFYNSCWVARGNACGDWETDSANGDCDRCLKTPSTSSAYGALIDFGSGDWVLNVPGCVSLAEPCNTPCAQVMLADIECASAACDSACGLDPNSCKSEANACDSCLAYYNVASCAGMLQGSGHRAVEFCGTGPAPPQFETQFTNIARFMCGP